MVFLKSSNLSLEQLVFFPGNERHGIWSSPHLMTIYASPPVAPKPGPRATAAAAKPAGAASTSPAADARPGNTASRGAARPN
jgi:hypothetical protein